MDEYRDAFLAESSDYVQQITDGLLAIERDSTQTEPVEVIFRGAHSLKGMSAAMGYVRTADLTHGMEGLMTRVRSGDLAVDSRLVDLMLAAVDLVRDLIDDESAKGHNVDSTAMVAALLTFEAAGAPPDAPADESVAVQQHDDMGLVEGQRGYGVLVKLESGCVLKAVRAYMVIKRLSHVGRIVRTLPSTHDIEDENFDQNFTVIVASAADADALAAAALHVSEVQEATVTEIQVETVQAAAASDVKGYAKSGRRRALPKLSETQTVRVSIGHLDTLVDLVGELIILRSRLKRISTRIADGNLSDTLDDMHRISDELQYEVMQTRMVPVGNIFNRFPRMVRDLAADLGKEIEFEIAGLDIELDRTVLDEIGDPIVHLLRNSIDHGIETAEERLRMGKPPKGSIHLTAVSEREHVTIVVSDDGKGIDIERVWAKAVQKGLVAAEEREGYSDGEILLFTCVPGFSTAEKSSKVSGRGVGLDVVKGKVEHLGGTLRIASHPGRGTDFILELPLTLAIVKALLVESIDQTFAIPLSAVTEVFASDEIRVDTIDGVPVLLLRDGDVVPLHRLDAILFGDDPFAALESRSHVLLIDMGGERHAVHVHALAGRQEVVIKPLSRLLKDAPMFSGATILGDGRVILILDPRTMFTAVEAHK